MGALPLLRIDAPHSDLAIVEGRFLRRELLLVHVDPQPARRWGELVEGVGNLKP